MLRTIKIPSNSWFKISSGNFYIEKEIGSGGFGSVYKASRDGISFALKLLRIWELLPSEREEIKKRVWQEYEISHILCSPNIVKTYFYEEIDENPLLIMDFCNEGSLREKIGRNLNEKTINVIAIDILKGLNDLHEHKIIHRDIKPENILFKDGRALLTDFGISANLKNRLTQRDIRGYARQIFASGTYAPPEQTQKSLAYKTTGPTNDIFSFGVLMYELLSKGSLPYGNPRDFEDNSEELLNKKMKGNWNREKLIQTTGKNYWYEIVRKCLQTDPKLRYKDVREIIEIIEGGASVETWKIQIMNGNQGGMIFNLTNLAKNKKKKILTIGRYDKDNPFVNDIYLKTPEKLSFVSLRHATLDLVIDKDITCWYIRDGQWYIKNEKKGWYPSRNGTLVNHQPVYTKALKLEKNDIICIGQITLKVI